MAIKMEGVFDVQRAGTDGYLSDESDFYGDSSTIQDLRDRSDTTSLHSHSKTHPLSLNQIAQSNILTAKSQKSTPLYNPYENQSYGRQLSETVPDFLARLPPRTSRAPDPWFPWITIANPYEKRRHKSGGLGGCLNTEGDGNSAEFQQRGTQLLRSLKTRKIEIEKINRGKSKTISNREVSKEVQKVVQEILDAATELRCSSGKWMIFTPPESVNEIWNAIALATADNQLGTAAKVAPATDDNVGKDRLICVYTRDFRDREDVERVVGKMRSLGLVEEGGRGIHYKCDAYTYLDIKRDNEFGIKASMYSSNEFLKTNPEEGKGAKGGKLNSLLYQKKKEPGDWKDA